MKKQKPPDPKDVCKKHIMVTRKINFQRIIGSSVKTNNLGSKEILGSNNIKKINNLDSKEILERIQDAVKRVNNVVFHTTHFLELYCLYVIRCKLEKPTFTKDYIGLFMKTVCLKSSAKTGGTFKQETLKKLAHLKKIYVQHYEPLMGPNPDDQKVDPIYLATSLAYEEINILTNIKNNISKHFIDYCKEWINKTFNLKERLKEVDKSNIPKDDKPETKRNVSIEMRLVKEDLLSPLRTPLKSDPKYHQWIKEHRPKIIRKTIFNKNQAKNNIEYEIKENTIDYLFSFIYVVDKLRTFGRNLQCFPLRSSFTPKYITIDSTALVTLMGNGSFINENNKVKDNHQKIWSSFFNLDHKVFKRKDFLFHSMIKTDGVGASILFYRKDVDPYKLPEDPLSSFTEHYVDEIDLLNPEYFNIVGIDPGKDDLIHCTDGKNNFFRYTANQRRFETRRKKYAKINMEHKLKTIIDHKNVVQWETELTKQRKCTTDFREFKEYLKVKLPLYKKLEPYYHDPLRRKLRWNTYMNTQKSEDNMLNNFQNKFGDPENTLVCIGDYDQKGYHLKGKEPAKGKGFRKLFRKKGYQVLLVDEFRTSIKCHNCFENNEKFRWRENHKPVRNKQTYQKTILVHGLLRCNSVNGCGVIWNRDVNGCLNIQMLAQQALFKLGKPLVFNRNFPNS